MVIHDNTFCRVPSVARDQLELGEISVRQRQTGPTTSLDITALFNGCNLPLRTFHLRECFVNGYIITCTSCMTESLEITRHFTP